MWQRVQAHLARNGRTGGGGAGGGDSLLGGLLRCAACDCGMTPTHTTKGSKRYRYYTCTSAAKKGWATCPAKSVPAHAIEPVLVGRIRAVGADPRVRAVVLAQARAHDEARTAELEREQHALEKDLRAWHGEMRHLSGLLRPGDGNEPVIRRLAELQERIAGVEGRGRAVRDQLAAVGRNLIADDDAAAALSVFDPVWEALNPREQGRVVNLLVQQVGYDGSRGKVTIRFRPAGVRTLARELAEEREERRA